MEDKSTDFLSRIEHALILAPYDANYCRSGQPYIDPVPCIIVRREGYPTLLGREDSEGASHVCRVSEEDLERARITGAMTEVKGTNNVT